MGTEKIGKTFVDEDCILLVDRKTGVIVSSNITKHYVSSGHTVKEYAKNLKDAQESIVRGRKVDCYRAKLTRLEFFKDIKKI